MVSQPLASEGGGEGGGGGHKKSILLTMLHSDQSSPSAETVSGVPVCLNKMCQSQAGSDTLTFQVC